MKFAAYMTWKLLCITTNLFAKIRYSCRDMEFFLKNCFSTGALCISRWVKYIILIQNAQTYYLPLPDGQPSPNVIRGLAGSVSELAGTAVTQLTDPWWVASLVTWTVASDDVASFVDKITVNFSVLRSCSCRCCKYQQ